MKILLIANQQKTESFKGLWGGSITDATSHEFGSFCNETFEYYPFKNESAEEIKNNTNLRISSYRCDNPSYTTSYTSDVIVKERLPFTEQEFDAYKALKGKKLDNNGIVIEDALAKEKLHCYMNNRLKYIVRKLFHKA